MWAYDFVEDRTETGLKMRILTVVDEFTRRCIEVEVEHKMNAKFVARTLLKLFAIHGTPTMIRSDNGPEFIAKFLMNVMQIHGVCRRGTSTRAARGRTGLMSGSTGRCGKSV